MGCSRPAPVSPGQTSGRFTDDSKVPEKPGLQQLVALEGCLVATQVPLDGGNGFENVAQAFLWISHTGTASCTTRSRILGLRPRSVTTSTGRPSGTPVRTG